MRLHTPRIELDRAPVFTPPTAQVALDEDTHNPNLLNLSSLFTDDYTGPAQLTYSIVSNSAQGVIAVAVSNGRFLDVDAATGSANDNWNGFLNVTVRATDVRGLWVEGTIQVWVRPVNDAPTIGPLVGTYVLFEDEPWQLFPQGQDVDNDTLTWSLTAVPPGPQINASTGAVHWTPTSADIGNHTVAILVSDGVLSATVTLLLTVLPSNDPPVLLPLPAVTVEEGVPFTFDLAPYIVDDDPLSSLSIMAHGDHVTLSGTVISGLVPPGTGLQVEKVTLLVTDPDGASVNGSLVLLIVPQGPRLALVGVPDLQVVETVPKTIDLTPHVKNAKSLSSVTLSADNGYATVSGLRVTFLVPAGAPEDAFRVRLTVREGDAQATWTMVVTVIRIGTTLLLADVPDMDVVAGVEVTLDLKPYLHNVRNFASLTFESSSPRAWVVGTSLHLLYPTDSTSPSESVTLTVHEGPASSSDTLSVFVHRQGAVLTVDPLPSVTVLEGEPYTFSLGPYIRGADPLTDVTVGADSPYASASGVSVTLLYPVGSGLAGDHIVLTTHWRGQTYTSLLEVTVVPWQAAFLLAGVPNVIVVALSPLTLPLAPYLHNLGDHAASDVAVTTDSPRVTAGPGPSLTFLYDSAWTGRSEVVLISATLEGLTRTQSIEVRVRSQGSGLALAPLPDLFAREDEPAVFDVEPFVLNMPPGGVVVLADSAFATVSGTTLTFLFPTEVGDVFVWITVVDGDRVAQGQLVVHVEPVNDPPTLVGSLQDRTARVGETVVFDLSQLFDDEESAGALVLRASDPRVTLDATARTASFVVPAEGAFEFVFTAVDPLNETLTVSAPAVTVTGKSNPAPHTLESGLDLTWLLLLVAAAAGVGLYAWNRRRPPAAGP
jgi:hypothetical protein